ncbi:meiotic recombination protein Spo11 [Aspergillus luchuensis]|uniref:Meiotic recombination protein Spo11 n=1 Tax=Aspergillus kawachii TaxID=1069201 RepID=A0A146FQF0_ASPKA|nr:meiotic recombination protein Spo11 [Aspergillus luchuensis]
MTESHLDDMEAEAFELPTNITTIPQTPVHSYIQETLAAILDEMSSPEGQPSITLRQRGKKDADIHHLQMARQRWERSLEIQYDLWSPFIAPSNEDIAVALRVLAAIAEAVQEGLVISKR